MNLKEKDFDIEEFICLNALSLGDFAHMDVCDIKKTEVHGRKAIAFKIESGIPSSEKYIQVPHTWKTENLTSCFLMPGSLCFIKRDSHFKKDDHSFEIDYADSGEGLFVFASDEYDRLDIFGRCFDDGFDFSETSPKDQSYMDESIYKLMSISTESKNAIAEFKRYAQLYSDLNFHRFESISGLFNKLIFNHIKSFIVRDYVLMNDIFDFVSEMPTDNAVDFAPYLMAFGRVDDAIRLAESSKKTPDCLLSPYFASVLANNDYFYKKYPIKDYKDEVTFKAELVTNTAYKDDISWDYWAYLQRRIERLNHLDVACIFNSQIVVKHIVSSFDSAKISESLVDHILNINPLNDHQLDRVNQFILELLKNRIMDSSHTNKKASAPVKAIILNYHILENSKQLLEEFYV